jgi:uncharacterized membrane protein YozB (DUF420 family)
MKRFSFAKAFAVVAMLSVPLAIAADASVRALEPRELPDALKAWVPWVLQEQPDHRCPFVYNAIENRRCVWPAKIAFALGAKGGTFSYQLELFAPAQVALPGSATAWPLGVSANGKPVQVTGTEPRVQLPAGSHTIAGNFVWSATPESLVVPEAVGIVALNLNGKVIEQPNRGDGGQLWLAQDSDGSNAVGASGAAASQLTVRINRLIEDDIPTLLTTQLELVASGKNQEVILPNAVLNGFTLLELQSKLPARLEADGKLRVQVRAGRWEITLVARNQSPLMSLASPNSAAVAASVTTTTAGTPANSIGVASTASSVSLPADEVWSFKARNEHRLVTLEGLTAVDPQQTTLPKAWRQFPSFVVRPTETLKFNETKRGDPQPAPDRLALKRNLWLDFDGRGYTVQDQISGTMNSSWRLEMAAPSVLGRAAVAGTDQFITTIPGGAEKTVGIEVRRGRANMVADSRIESDSRTLSAVGWQKDFNSVSANLHLPPGWRLISAQGADSARTAWVAKWTLLDLFLLLMIALSFGRLFGVKWGAISLVAMVLAYHEAVPVATWLIVLAVVALIRVLPKENKFAKFMQVARVAALLWLAVTLLPFMVSQVRQSMYPVLEKPYEAVMGGDAYGARDAGAARIEQKMEAVAAAAPVAAAAEAAAPVETNVVQEASEPAAVLTKEAAGPASGISYSKTARMRAPSEKNQATQNATFRLDNYDSKAMIQTGPGLPGWTWNTHPISWSGPVEKSQSLSLWLVSPLWSALLRVMSVILLGAMLLCVLDAIKRWPAGLTPKQGGDVDFSKLNFGKWSRRKDSTAAQSTTSVVVAVMFSCIGAVATLQSNVSYAQLPTVEQLEQLKAKLTVAPSCLPNCASIARMSVSASGDSVALRLEIHANEDVAIPLPGGGKDWQPQQILLNGKPVSAIYREGEGVLWLRVPSGVHPVQMLGSRGGLDVIALSMPLKPNRVDAQLSGWTLDGVNENGQADNSLTLSRSETEKKQKDGAVADAKQGGVAPFFRVERTLSLGLQWQVTTRVVRVSTANVPVSLEVGLLDGESITTPEPRVEKGKALVSMAPQTSEIIWESTLKETPSLMLTASKQTNQFEVWQLNPGTQWHFVLSGIAVTAHQEADRWSPKWQPWPGEVVKIAASKPTGTAGQTLTIDGAVLSIKPGLRATDSTLSTTLRSSRGGQHAIQLPEGATLQNVEINGQSQPIRLEGRELRLPLVPGTQKVQITWREPAGIALRYVTPTVNLNATSVNSRIQLMMPTDRWTLFVAGPAIGPAVLIWGVLIVLVCVAYGLGKIAITPLRMLQWLLLGLGFTQVPVITAGIFVGWLFALGLRRHYWPTLGRVTFNLGQIGIVMWTFVALVALIWAVSQGLLGQPDMQITGNGSTSQFLSWFADRSGNVLPTAWTLSVPLWVYRGLMLLWALWLAYSLLTWLKWGWESFTSGGYWRAKLKVDTAAGGDVDALAAAQSETQAGSQ